MCRLSNITCHFKTQNAKKKSQFSDLSNLSYTSVPSNVPKQEIINENNPKEAEEVNKSCCSQCCQLCCDCFVSCMECCLPLSFCIFLTPK